MISYTVADPRKSRKRVNRSQCVEIAHVMIGAFWSLAAIANDAEMNRHFFEQLRSVGSPTQ